MKNKYISLKSKKIIVLFLFLISFFSCDENKSKIPNVYVEIYLDLTDPLYSSLTIPGNYLYVTGGVNGIIVYHTIDDEFRAYERTCPYDPECGKVFVDEYSFNAVDSICCKSEFSLLSEGVAVQGPAKNPLKQYKCIYNQNSRILSIKNQ